MDEGVGEEEEKRREKREKGKEKRRLKETKPRLIEQMSGACPSRHLKKKKMFKVKTAKVNKTT